MKEVRGPEHREMNHCVVLIGPASCVPIDFSGV